MKSIAHFILAVAVTTCSGGCRPARERRAAAVLGERQQQFELLRSMESSALVKALGEDSAEGLAPFNSPAFEEAIRRGQGLAAELATAVKTGDARSLPPLLALQRIDPKRYSEVAQLSRVAILVANLRGTRSFNAWGVPHLYWEQSGRALIAEGAVAVPALTPLLKDHRPASILGSEVALASRGYQYRLCDYAWALINAIQNRPQPIPLSSVERDQVIAEMTRRLSADQR